MKGYLFRLLNHEELSREEMKTILIGITQSEYPNEQITALLTCLQMRGVTVEELLGLTATSTLSALVATARTPLIYLQQRVSSLPALATRSPNMVTMLPPA